MLAICTKLTVTSELTKWELMQKPGVPAQACESWPIRADWAFHERSIRQRVNRGAAATHSMSKSVCFLNIKACKHSLLDTQNKNMNLNVYDMGFNCIDTYSSGDLITLLVISRVLQVWFASLMCNWYVNLIIWPTKIYIHQHLVCSLHVHSNYNFLCFPDTTHI